MYPSRLLVCVTVVFVWPLLILNSFALAEDAENDCSHARQMREYEIVVFRRLQTTGDSVYHTTGCFVCEFGYWSYEICPGRWVRQFRQESSVIVEENFLGVQHQWQLLDVIGMKALKYQGGSHTVPDRLKALHTVPGFYAPLYTCPQKSKVNNRTSVVAKYVGGSPCVGGLFRSATLHYVCDEDVVLPLVEFFEPFLCYYEMVVTAKIVCDAIFGRVVEYDELADSDMRFVL